MAILEYKTIGEAEAYVQSNGAKLRDAVQKSLRFPKLSAVDAFWISRRLLWISFAIGALGIALFITGIVLLSQQNSNRSAFMGLAIAGGILFSVPGAIITFRSLRLNKIKSQVQFDAVSAYQQFFTDNFDNLTVSGPINRAQATTIALRPAPVPADAIISKINPGVMGKMDEFDFITYWATWRWQRTTGTGKNADTKTYYYYVLGGAFDGLNERYANFAMHLRYPASDGISNFFGLGKRSTKLENTSFEKRTALTSNDEIALRRVLTPRTQELIMDRITKSINYTEVRVGQGGLNVLRQDTHECFQVNFRMNTDRDKVVASYTQDLMSDIAHFIAFISHIHDYATLSRG